ncbi:thioredoxin domain-containing protein 15 [Toxorhynchites rutilus septentrionalis]|uniref:thioredoxin domain-containing protein 15 n=1 Tax=Toxorhynchites rutilus septentrionalis TaxID=329112 RepID=UPI002478CAC2|nr:thioredoxin domain-containing protein 15 [Toxorhynchites rutilus septentrionalis]
MKLFFHLISIILVLNSCYGYRFSALEFYAHILNGDFLDYKPFGNSKSEDNHHVAVSVGQSPNSFLDFITYKDKKQCSIYEEQAVEVDDARVSDGKRNLLKVKCIPAKGNGTLHIITSLKEAISVLAPHGNSTKRSHAGSCVVMLFYTTTCIHSAMMAPHYNALARYFPDLKVAAIDALNFNSLNTEFGIVGLPTILFFHQGRPLVKFNDTAFTLDTLVKFVTKHSGVEPRLDDVREPHYISDDFKGPLSNKVEKKIDYWLYVAWIFIIVCSCYYFSKSVLYVQMIEMVKRNWRESEAHHRS